MHGISKKVISGIVCAAFVLTLGKSADVSDIIIGRNSQQSVSQKESYNLKSNSNKVSVSNTSETKKGSNTANDNDDWLDKNGELKSTVIVDKEKDYYESDNRIIIEYRNNGKEPAELSKYADKEKDIDNLIKVYHIKSKEDTKKVIEITKKYSSDIQIAQPDYKFSIASQDSEVTDYYKEGKQWALENDGTFENPKTDVEDANIKAVEDVDLNAQGAWDLIANSQDTSVKTKEVVVAVVDTGIDYTNDELKDVIWQNEDETSDGKDSDNNGYRDDIRGWNFVSRRGSSDATDDNGHGTAVAGVIAAANDNSGVVGIASNINIKIMPVKSVDSNGEASMSNLISGMKYADANGASICNCSWGGESDAREFLQNTLMEQVIATSDMLFVAASGNESTNIDRTQYIPASFTANNLITVGSIEWDGSLSWFSNYGSNAMEICAPGAAIYTVNAGGGYVVEWGTSFSAPYVAGVAALAEAASGSSDGTVLKDLICDSDNIKKISGLEKYCQYGGIPDAEKVVEVALNYSQTEQTSITVTPAASETPTSTPTSTATVTKTPDNTVSQEPDVSVTSQPNVSETRTPEETLKPDGGDAATTTAEPTATPIATATPEAETTASPDTSLTKKNADINISVKSKLYKKYARRISVTVNGSISEIKYSKGKKEASYFNTFGNEFTNINSSSFTIKAYEPGWYTIYVKTTDGKEKIKNVFANVRIVTISKTKLSIKKGTEYKLTASIKEQSSYPEKLTGDIYFKTSNKKVVSVNTATGKIKAKSKGKAVITAYTKNGKSARCIVICK